MHALWYILGAITYLNTGYWWGKASYKAWQKQKRTAVGLLCFPLSYAANNIGRVTDIVRGEDGFTLTPIHDFKNVDNYAKCMTFVWPAKATMNILTLTALILATVCTNPKSLLPRRSIKELPKPAPKELPPVETSDPDQFDIHEYQNLLEQRDKIAARLKELEAHPDKQKLLMLPRRP